MFYIDNRSTDPHYNLAMEEYLLKSSGREFFILWQNAPSVIVGKNQNTLSEINADFIKERDIPVVRRLTGGGAVFHDLGNLNYTFIANDREGGPFDFEKHTAPIVKALLTLSVEACFSGRNDLVIEGKKFSGNAQCRYKDRLLHHGTLLFASRIFDISAALRVDPSKFEGKSIQSVQSRVTNISEHLKSPLTLSEFKQLILAQIGCSHAEIAPYELTKGDTAGIKRLAKEKYMSWEWNYGSSPAYNFSNRKKLSGGSVEAFMRVDGGNIDDIKLYGDFFGECDIGEIEEALKGVRHEEEAIRQRLSAFDLSRYFSDIGFEELISLLF